MLPERSIWARNKKILHVVQEGIPEAPEVYEGIREADVWAALSRAVRIAEGDAVDFDLYRSAKFIPGGGKSRKFNHTSKEGTRTDGK